MKKFLKTAKESKNIIQQQKPIIILTILIIMVGGLLSFYGFMESEKIFGIRAMTVDSKGNIYLIFNDTLCKLDKDGNIIFSCGKECQKQGEFGPGTPMDLALDRDENIYVADIGNYRIEKFDKNGEFVFSFGTRGTSPGTFGSLIEIAVDNSGNIYAVDSPNHRLQKFDAKGKLLFAVGGKGDGEEEFDYPHDPFIGKDGKIYVCDYRNARVQCFDSEGKFTAQYKTREEQHRMSGRSYNLPQRIAGDAKSNYYLINYDLALIDGHLFKYDSNFELLKKIDLSPCGIDYLDFPSEIVGSSDGTLFISQELPMRIDQLGFDGNYLGRFGSKEVLSIFNAVKEKREGHIDTQKTGQFLLILGVILTLVVYWMYKRSLSKSGK